MANQFLYANFFATELIASVGVGDTVLQIPPSAAQQLQNFTSGFYAPMALWDGQNPPEIVYVTENPQTGALTVIRGQEGTSPFGWSSGTQLISSLTAGVINAALQAYNTGLVLIANYLPLSGGTLTGFLTLSGNPTLAGHAATKGYVDSQLGTLLPLSGGTLSGNLSMNDNRLLALPTPTTGSEPATKAYADGLNTSLNTALSNFEANLSGSYVTGGTGAAYTVATLNNQFAGGLVDGVAISFRLNATNQQSPTLAVDGTAAVALRQQSTVNLGPGVLQLGAIYTAEYRAAGPEWIISSKNITTYNLTAGGSLAYTLSTGLGIQSLQDGLTLGVVINTANTGAVTLNVDGLGAIPLRPNSTVDFKTGQLKQYTSLLIRYNNVTGEWLTQGWVTRLDQAQDTAISAPTTGQELVYNGTSWINGRNSPRGYIDGCILSNDGVTPTTTIDIAAGLTRADDDTIDIPVSAFTKTTAAFAVGTGLGGLDTGAIGNSLWYYVFAILNTSNSAVDILFSLSPSAPTMPTGYTKKRRVGAFSTDVSGHIVLFTQFRDEFRFSVPVVTLSNVSTGNTRTLIAVGPTGIKTIALLRAFLNNNTLTGGVNICSPDEADAAVPAGGGVASLVTVANSANQAGEFLVRTDSSGNIAFRGSNSNLKLFISTLGWIDPRGRDS